MKHQHLVILSALVMTACGPTLPINAGVQQAGANVFFGEPTAEPTPGTPPPPHVNIVPNFPALGEAPPAPPAPAFSPGTVTVPTPPPAACPTASPLSFPAVTATPAATQPPPSGAYAWRYNATYTAYPGAPNQKVTVLPMSGTRTVSAKAGANGSYLTDVVETYNAMQTTTQYEVFPEGPANQAVGPAMPAAGLYLTSIKTNSDIFQPASPVELMPFPANGTQSQTTVTSSGTDPITAETLEIGPQTSNAPSSTPPPQSGVVGDKRVDACGAVIDTYELLLYGQFVDARGGPGSRTFALELDVATQYGGISVSDHLTETGTDQASGQPYKYDLLGTIDEVPNSP